MGCQPVLPAGARHLPGGLCPARRRSVFCGAALVACALFLVDRPGCGQAAVCRGLYQQCLSCRVGGFCVFAAGGVSAAKAEAAAAICPVPCCQSGGERGPLLAGK